MKKIAFFALASFMFLIVNKSVLACKGSQTLYEDSFATLDPAWGTQGPNLSVNNGKLILQPDVNTGFVALNKSKLFVDIDACVNVNMAKSDDARWGGGLVFWAKDDSNYYALLASGDGEFSVRRYVNGTSSAVVDWRESPSVKKGIGQINQLRIVTKGNQATAYINDTEVATFNGEPPQGGSFIGVKGSSAEKSPIVWEFSNLKITNVTSSPVSTVTSPPTVTNVVSGCKGNQVLYQDNFATLDPAWGAQSPNLSASNGKLIIQPEINNSFTALNQANLFQDMDFCVNVSPAKSDDPTYSAGPIFWGKDSSDYFYFVITGDGWFAIKHWVNGRALEPVTWRQSDAIKKGVGQINQLHLVIKGDQVTAYINDREVVTFKGQPPQGGGFIGLIAFSPQKATNKNVWEFSDLKVTK